MKKGQRLKVKGQRLKVKGQRLKACPEHGRRVKGQRSSGLSVLAVVITLMLIVTFALVAAALISIRSNITSEDVNAKRALYIAEAGLAVAKHTLYGDWSKLSDPDAFPLTSFAGGTFDAAVAATADPDQATVTVTGIIGDSKRVIQSTVSRYSQAMTSAVYSNGAVTVGGSSSVTGDVVESDIYIPTLDEAAAIAAAMANYSNGYDSRPAGNYFQGDFDPDPASLNGVIFIGPYPDGSPANVNIAGNISTNDGNPAFLIVMGDLVITGNVTFHGLIYTTGSVGIDTEFLGNMTLDGALITSGNVSLQGNSDVTYNADMVITATTTSLLTGEDTPQEISWKEISP